MNSNTHSHSAKSHSSSILNIHSLGDWPQQFDSITHTHTHTHTQTHTTTLGDWPHQLEINTHSLGEWPQQLDSNTHTHTHTHTHIWRLLTANGL